MGLESVRPTGFEPVCVSGENRQEMFVWRTDLGIYVPLQVSDPGNPRFRILFCFCRHRFGLARPTFDI